MDIKEHCKDALKFLTPLFGAKRFSIDTLAGEGDWESLHDRVTGEEGLSSLTLHLPCHPLFIAGDFVGGELVGAYNKGKFEKDKSLRVLLYGVGASYASYAYHASLCSKDCDKPDLKPIEEHWRKARARFANSSKPEGKLASMIWQGALIHPLGYLLNKNKGTSMLGPYARMSAEQAKTFLSENTPFEALGG